MTRRLSPDGIAASAVRGVLQLLPARSRERYAEELADVYAGILRDAARTGGDRRVLCTALAVFRDLCGVLAAEYLDAWRRARCNPHVVGAGLLGMNALAWLLILAASAGVSGAASILDLSLAATMAAAFGAPLATMVLSRVRLCRYTASARGDRLFGLSAAASSAWLALLTLHVSSPPA